MMSPAHASVSREYQTFLFLVRNWDRIELRANMPIYAAVHASFLAVNIGH